MCYEPEEADKAPNMIRALANRRQSVCSGYLPRIESTDWCRPKAMAPLQFRQETLLTSTQLFVHLSLALVLA